MRRILTKLLLPALCLALASCASVPVAIKCPKPVASQHPELENSPPTVQKDVRTILQGPSSSAPAMQTPR